MFSKSKVYYNQRHWQPLFCPVYALYRPLAVDKPFEKLKYKSTPGTYLGMYTIHLRTLSLVTILSAVMVSPKFHVSFDSSFATINCIDGNLVLPSYWYAMCGFIKVNESIFVHSEQRDPSSTFISPSYQGRTTSDNLLEP